MASLRRFTASPYWIAVFRDLNGRQCNRSTKVKVAGEGATPKERGQDAARKRQAALTIAQQFEQTARGHHTEAHVRRVLRDLFNSVNPQRMDFARTDEFLRRWLASMQRLKKTRTHERYEFVIETFLASLGARARAPTRDELRYILDPADTHGPDYPTETFRVLKQNEIAGFGEYRTRRLVLAAWDALEKSETSKVELAPPVAATVPTWMDQPLVAPSSPRLPVPPDVYRSAIVPHLLHQAGGRINFERFRRAYWLLSEPKTLAKYGKESLGSVVTAWKKSTPPPLDQTKFIPHLRGAVRDDLQFVTVTDERHLQLRRTDHLVRDDHIIFDARLALLVADLWPSSEPIAPLTAEEEKVVRELELIA